MPEYSSRQTSRRGAERRARPRAAGPIARSLRSAVAGAVVLGAILLAVAEPTTLFTVHTATSRVPLSSTTTGAHHSYALVLLAILAAFMALGIALAGSRIALSSVGLCGLAALLVALLHDLPGAEASGVTHAYAIAKASPSIGLYLETLGAVVLVVASGSGLILLDGPVARRSRGPRRS